MSEEVQGCIQSLHSKDSATRNNATGLLVQMGDIAIPALIKALKDKEQSVRISAVEILGTIGDVSVIPALVDALKEDSFIHCHAVEALGKIGDVSAIPALIDALKFKGVIRIYVVQALSKIGYPAVPALIGTLRHWDDDVRSAVTEVLFNIGDAQAVPVLIYSLKDRDSNVRYYAAKALDKVGIFAVPALIEALKDSDYYVRKYVHPTLSAFGVQIVTDLVGALKDKHPNVRSSASELLGLLGSVQDLPHKVLACRNMNAHQKHIAMLSLSRCRKGRRFQYPVGDVQKYCANLVASDNTEVAVRNGANEVLEASNLLRATHAPEDFNSLPRPMYNTPDSNKSELLRSQNYISEPVKEPHKQSFFDQLKGRAKRKQ